MSDEMNTEIPWYDRHWHVTRTSDPTPIDTGFHDEYIVKATIAPHEMLNLTLIGMRAIEQREPIALGAEANASIKCFYPSFFPSPSPPPFSQIVSCVFAIVAKADEYGKVEAMVKLQTKEKFALNKIRCFDPEDGEIEIFADGIPMFAGPLPLAYLREYKFYVKQTWRQVLEDRLDAWLDQQDEEEG